MPIRPENANRYPSDWSETSRRIRFDRAGGQCECTGQCGLHRGRRCEERHGEPARFANGAIVLTTAHLNHQPEDCGDDNLRAMCQRCHLRYDRQHHKVSAGEAAGQQRLDLEATNA
jgi:hypothetical protein